MIEPVDSRLDDAILAEPSAIEPRRVLADFLEGHGHPRAALIRLAIDGKETTDWFARHADIAGQLGRGVTVRWRLGYCDELALTNVHDVPIETLWPTIATHRSYRFLRELTLARDFRFDPALPPPDAIRSLRIFYGRRALESLATIVMPRVSRLFIDQHVRSATLDTALVAPLFERALPALTDLVVTKCLDEPSTTALVAQIVRSPLRERLRRLELDRLTDAAACALLDAGMKLRLLTACETIATTTRDRLRRAMHWKPGGSEPAADRASRAPVKAPAEYATMPAVTLVEDHGDWVKVWAGAGVTLHDHPCDAWGGTACGGCRGSHTHVIWARSELQPSHAGPDGRGVQYELVCRECGQFTVYDASVS